ncbi:MAG: hypothetical protein KA419_17700 [Acidobacteria bacterium]|nr:hypothetical protein [Acidobacteriota bacterium]
MKRWIALFPALSVFAALAVLAACHKADAPPAAPGAPPASAAARPAEAREILMNPIPPRDDPAIFKAMEPFRQGGYQPLGEQCWLDTPKPKSLMLFAKPGQEAHAAGAVIGGLFSEYDPGTEKWELRAQSLSITETGSWGAAPEPLFLRLGPDRYGFLIEPGFTNQGYTEAVTVVYGVLGNRFVPVLQVPSHRDNGGTSDNPAETGAANVSLYQVPDAGKEFYDVLARLAVEGKYAPAPDDEMSKVFGAAREARFTFRNGAYERAGGAGK